MDLNCFLPYFLIIISCKSEVLITLNIHKWIGIKTDIFTDNQLMIALFLWLDYSSPPPPFNRSSQFCVNVLNRVSSMENSLLLDFHCLLCTRTCFPDAQDKAYCKFMTCIRYFTDNLSYSIFKHAAGE